MNKVYQKDNVKVSVNLPTHEEYVTLCNPDVLIDNKVVIPIDMIDEVISLLEATKNILK